MEKGFTENRYVLEGFKKGNLDNLNMILSSIGTAIAENSKCFHERKEKVCEFSTIVIQRNFLGAVKKKSVEEGFQTVYKDLSEGFKIHADAIGAINDNIGLILKLIAAIIRIESDIYEKIDSLEDDNFALSLTFEQYSTDIINGFKEIIQDSDELKENEKEFLYILEGLKNRTYTLRDRLRMLQEKINARVDDIVEKIQARIDSLENEQNRFFIEGKKELLKETEQLKAELVQEFEEKSKEISRCLQENQRKGEELREEMRRNINHAKDELSSSTQKCEQILAQVIAKEQQIVSDYDSKCKCLQDSITKHENRLDEKSNHVSQSLTSIAKNNECEFAKSKNKLLEISAEARENLESVVSDATEDFSKQLNAQQERFDSLIELQKKTARRTLIYVTSIAVVLSTCISVVLCLTL